MPADRKNGNAGRMICVLTKMKHNAVFVGAIINRPSKILSKVLDKKACKT
jgi:hypothetical protein